MNRRRHQDQQLLATLGLDELVPEGEKVIPKLLISLDDS